MASSELSEDFKRADAYAELEELKERLFRPAPMLSIARIHLSWRFQELANKCRRHGFECPADLAQLYARYTNGED